MSDSPGNPTEMSHAIDLGRPTRVHVVGVAGAGMSAIASVLKSMGHSVSGSDLRASTVTERLAGEGIKISLGHGSENVAGAAVVTFSPAVPDDNVELREARRLGIPVASRATVLAAISACRKSIAVAGTHGKTTTSSMLSLMLVEAGARPSFLIGADVGDLDTNAVWEEGEWLVLEADESYGTFQELHPEVTLLTSVEPDHLDHYGTESALSEAFEHLISATNAQVVVSADDPVAARLGRSHGAVTVGEATDADWRILDLALHRSSSSFGLESYDGRTLRVSVAVPGLHNVKNAALAAVTALLIGVPADAALAALARFAGVSRRFEFRGEMNGVTFVDDYAHLPSEVKAALATARGGGWSRVLAVFQPHRYSRTASLARSFGDAFSDADAVVITDVFGAGEQPLPGVSGRLVADAVMSANAGAAVSYVPTREELVNVVRGMLRPGDICCTLGAGDLTTLPDELMATPDW